MNVVLKPAGHELVLTRELKAPRERVFAAWTDPEQAVALVGAAGLHPAVVRDGRASGRRLAAAHARASGA